MRQGNPAKPLLEKRIMKIYQFTLATHQKFSEEGIPENFETLLVPDSGYSEAIDFENVEGHVDQELADSVHEEEPQAWFDEYVRLHWEKYNEIFRVN